MTVPDCCPGTRDAPPGGKTATAPGGGFLRVEGDSVKLGVGPNGSFWPPNKSVFGLVGGVGSLVLIVLADRLLCEPLCVGRGLASSDGC